MFLIYFVCLYLIGIKTNNIKVIEAKNRFKPIGSVQTELNQKSLHYEDEINFIALTQFGIAPNLLPYTKVIICL